MIRKSPTYLAFAFILITLARVAEFAQNRMLAGWLGWPFAIGMGLGVFLVAGFTRDSITRQDGKEDPRSRKVKTWAWVILAFLAVIDMAFNTAEVWLSVQPKAGDYVTGVGAALYGAFPTIVAALLGILQGHIDRLPKPPRKSDGTPSVLSAFRRLILAQIGGWTKAVKRNASEAPAHLRNAQKQSGASPKQKKYPCKHCGGVFDSPSALANHNRWTHPKAAVELGADHKNGKVHPETISETGG